MTHPSDPGHPPRPETPGHPAGAYGPPPGPVPGPQQQQQQHQQQQHQQPPTGPVPGPRPPEGQQEWVAPQRRQGGVLGALLDTEFNSLVTPSLVKTIYVLALLVVSLECLAVFVLGLWTAAATPYWVTGIVIMLATPVLWLFQMLLTRILMEAVVIRFKQAEYLQVIKDKL